MTDEIKPEVVGEDAYCLCECRQWVVPRNACLLQNREWDDPAPFMCVVWHKRQSAELVKASNDLLILNHLQLDEIKGLKSEIERLKTSIKFCSGSCRVEDSDA